MSVVMEWVDDPRRWNDYREIWDGIVDRSERPSIFVTWDFLETCWHCFAPAGSRLAIGVFREGDHVIGFAPLIVTQRRRFGMPLRLLGHLAGWEATRVPLVLPHERFEECARALLDGLDARAREWDYLQLNEVDPATALPDAFRSWAGTANGYRVVAVESSPSPYIGIEQGVDAWLAGLGASSRKSFRRYQRQLEALGECRLETFEEPADMDRALDAYLDLESRSWKPKAGQGVGKDQRNRDFYRQLLPKLASKRRAAVVFLTVNGKRIAANIEVWLRTTAYCPQTVFDAEYAKYSPGNVVQVMSLRWHVPRGITEYGLFGRFLENKMRFTRDSRPNVNLRLLQLRGLRRLIQLGPGMMKAGKPPAPPEDPVDHPDDAAGP